MPIKSYKDTQNATIFGIIVISLIMAVISTVEYCNTDTPKVKDYYKKWYTICYSVSGALIFLQIVFNRKINVNNYIDSVPV